MTNCVWNCQRALRHVNIINLALSSPSMGDTAVTDDFDRNHHLIVLEEVKPYLYPKNTIPPALMMKEVRKREVAGDGSGAISEKY